MIKMVRNNELKKEKTSFGIIDAKSIKNADNAEQKGYDAGKKISGIKLHIVVDTLMLLMILCYFKPKFFNSRINAL